MADDRPDEMLEMLRPQFEAGYHPMDEPPGFEERAYKKWVEQGGRVDVAEKIAAETAARLVPLGVMLKALADVVNRGNELSKLCRRLMKEWDKQDPGSDQVVALIADIRAVLTRPPT